MNQEDLMGEKTESIDSNPDSTRPFLSFSVRWNEKFTPIDMAKTGMFLPINKNHNQGR
jgi:hypothetical protein